MMYDTEAGVTGGDPRDIDESDSDDDGEPNTLQNDGIDTSSDDDDDDCDDQKTVKTRELEWDDSTLSY